MKVRQNLYIDRTVSDALEALAAGTRGNKSRLANDALADWLDRRASRKADELLKPRLDRIARAQERMARDLEIVLESLSLFIRHQLTVTAPLPKSDKAAIAVGFERFDAFVADVGRQLAQGRATMALPDTAEAAR